MRSPNILALTAIMVMVHSTSSAEPGWKFNTYVGFETEPSYTGSNVYTSSIDYNIEVQYEMNNGNIFFVNLGEAGAWWQLNDDWTIGTVLEFEPGRENSANPILKDFPEQENTLEAQVSIIRDFGDFKLAAVLQPDILGRGKGFVYFAGLQYEMALFEQFKVDFNLDVSGADAEHMNTEVGIDAATSAKTGIPSYKASGGFKSASLALNPTFFITPKLSLKGKLGAEFYGNNMAQSPLIETYGSAINFEAGLGISYAF